MRLVRFAPILALLLVGSVAQTATAARGGSTNQLKVSATEFDPQHDCDANAAWVKGIGVSSANDPYAYGLRMHKLCSTDTNAAAFGVISGVKGELLVSPLGFDYKNSNAGFDAHCGAGAPRFNVTMSDGSFHFVGGCSNGTAISPSPLAGTGWTQVRIDPQSAVQSFPPVPTNATIVSIALVFDEGSDVCCFNGSPEIVLDNITINGKVATKP